MMEFVGVTLDKESLSVVETVKEALKSNRSAALRYIITTFADLAMEENRQSQDDQLQKEVEPAQ